MFFTRHLTTMKTLRMHLLLWSLVVFSLAADDEVVRRDNWSAAPVGSWVTQRESLVADGKTVQADIFTLKKTMENSKGSYVGKGDPGDLSKLRGRLVEAKTPEELKLESGRVDTVKLTVGGRQVSAARQDWTSKSVTLTLWSSDDIRLPVRVIPLPGRNLVLQENVVKVDYTGKKGGSISHVTWQVEGFDKKVVCRGRDFRAVVCKLTTKTTGNKDHSGAQQIWLSKLVPGGILKMEGTGTQDGRSFKVRTEVLQWGWPGQILPAAGSDDTAEP